jgi:hypothetical protein
MSELRLTVASWEEREDLVIELTVEDDTQIDEWGLVTYDEIAGKPVIDLYPRPDGGEWHFDLDEVSAILARARKRIMEVAGPITSEQSGIESANNDQSSGTQGRTTVPVGAGSARSGSSQS